MNMKANQPTITGIVVEYNPFHNGHIYHIQQAREITNCDCLIAIMSPNFVQRGEPAFIDKWQRTQVALTHGVDLVLELPTHIALQSAETFATHAVSLLALAGITDLVYGSETGQTPSLTPLDMSLSKQGFSYAKAKNTDQKGPNNILGAYYEASANLHHIKTHQILRSNKYHGLELDHHIASATAIRRAYFDNKSITPYTPMNISKPHQITDYWPLIRYEIIKEQQQLASRFLISEGLENKLTKEALCHSDYQAFLNACTSKRYTISRIQRSLMHILLHTPLNIAKQTQIRVLGANHLGRQYIKNNALFVTSFKQYQYKDLEEKATQIYALPNNETHLIKQEKSSPIILP